MTTTKRLRKWNIASYGGHRFDVKAPDAEHAAYVATRLTVLPGRSYEFMIKRSDRMVWFHAKVKRFTKDLQHIVTVVICDPKSYKFRIVVLGGEGK
jgi:hypothetical protein